MTAQRAQGEAETRLRIVAVGGFGRVGMNCLAFEQLGDRLVVDCGVAFGGDDWGIEMTRPSFEPLLSSSAELRGVVLTHGHEDHIGALADLLGERPVPVWAPPYALELCRRRLSERFGASRSFDLHELRPRDSIEVGSFGVEGIRTVHSTVDALALGLATVAGRVVHSGDFKLDRAPGQGEPTDEQRFAELGDLGVRLLLADSTNSTEPGRSGTERSVAEALERVAGRASGRVVVGIFASNVERLRAIGHLARRLGRKLCPLGRSVVKHVEVATALGWLDWPAGLVVPAELAARYGREELLFVATGTQGETYGALRLLAVGQHPTVTLEPGDTVILSSRIIVGRSSAVQGVVDGLLRQGVEVHSRRTDRALHVSGHACRDEQRRLLDLVRPELFVPIHGTREQLVRHAALAAEQGIDQSLLLDEGDALELTSSEAIVRPHFTSAQPVALARGGTVAAVVLRERQQLGRAGVVFVAVRPRSADHEATGREPPPPDVRVDLAGVSDEPELEQRLAAVVASAWRDQRGLAGQGAEEQERRVQTAVRRELKRCGVRRPTVRVVVFR